jgi:hypothetical protein
MSPGRDHRAGKDSRFLFLTLRCGLKEGSVLKGNGKSHDLLKGGEASR